MNLGEWFKTKRNDKEITQQEMADKIKCTAQYISNIEANKANPSIPYLKAFMSLCGVKKAEVVSVMTEEKRKYYEERL